MIYTERLNIMNKNVLIINGSCRKGGNTDKLISMTEEGAKCLDINIIKHVLRNKSIENCNGCYYCYKNTRCSIKDDMQEIYNDIEKTDLMILASPMYWWSVTGLMKTFIDRLYLYYPKSNTPLIAGKKLLMMVPMNVNPSQHGEAVYQSEIEPLKMTSKYIFKRLGIVLLDIKFYPGLNNKASIKEHKEYLEDACELGRALKNYF